MGGILVIVSLFTFRITLVSGTINGLIFSASVAHTGLLDILAMKNPKHSILKSYTKFISVVLHWLNLQAGFSVCLYNGMDAIVKTAVQPIFCIYLFLLVILIGLISRYSQRLSNLISSSAIPVLATTIHISFSHLCISAIESFMWNSVFVENGTTIMVERVWLIDGNVQYFDVRHVALMVSAGVVTISLTLPYLVLVTFGLQLMHISFINKYFKPILDVVYAPVPGISAILVRGSPVLAVICPPDTRFLLRVQLSYSVHYQRHRAGWLHNQPSIRRSFQEPDHQRA